MAGINHLRQVKEKKGDDFLNNLLNNYVIINKKTEGTFFGMRKDKKTDSLKYFKKAGIEDKIEQHIGNAMEIIPTINLTWDLVFIDADKENYSNYFDLVIDKMSIGSFLVADNVLWSGKVVEPLSEKDSETKEIIKFNDKIHQSDRVENVLMPIRDGLMVCRKIK